MLVLLTRLITRKGRVVLNRKYVKHGEEWRWRDATTMSSAGRLPGDVVESRVCWRSLAESLQSSIEKRANPRWKSNAWNEEKRNDDATTLLISRRTFLFPFLLLLFSLWHRRFQFAANARARKLSLSLSLCLCSVYSFFHPASRIFRLPACIPRKYTDYSPNHWFRRFLSFFSPDGKDGEQRIKKKKKDVIDRTRQRIHVGKNSCHRPSEIVLSCFGIWSTVWLWNWGSEFERETWNICREFG